MAVVDHLIVGRSQLLRSSAWRSPERPSRYALRYLNSLHHGFSIFHHLLLLVCRSMIVFYQDIPGIPSNIYYKK